MEAGNPAALSSILNKAKMPMEMKTPSLANVEMVSAASHKNSENAKNPEETNSIKDQTPMTISSDTQPESSIENESEALPNVRCKAIPNKQNPEDEGTSKSESTPSSNDKESYKWLCESCEKEIFSTYAEAAAHEAICRKKKLEEKN